MIDASAIRSNVGRRLELLMAVFDHEAESGESLGVVAAADAVGREKSQVSRGLRDLTDARLARRDPETLEFAAGAPLMQLAARAGDQALAGAASAALRALAAEAAERAHLTVVCGTEVLTVETIAPASALQAVGWVGRLTPLHCTASGAALLMDYDPEALRELLGPDPLPPAGPAAATNLEELCNRLATARETSVALADGEFEHDLLAVAAPVRGGDGRIVAAVNVSGPAARMRPRVEALRQAVRTAANRISERLDGEAAQRAS